MHAQVRKIMAKTMKRNTNWYFDARAFGRNLKERREEEGYSLRALSDRIARESSEAREEAEGQDVEGFYISITALRKWEAGESLPTVENLFALATTLNPHDWEGELVDLVKSGAATPCAESLQLWRATLLCSDWIKRLTEEHMKIKVAALRTERTLKRLAELFEESDKTTIKQFITTLNQAKDLVTAFVQRELRLNANLDFAKESIKIAAGEKNADFVDFIVWPEPLNTLSDIEAGNEALRNCAEEINAIAPEAGRPAEFLQSIPEAKREELRQTATKLAKIVHGVSPD